MVSAIYCDQCTVCCTVVVHIGGVVNVISGGVCAVA